MTKNASELRKNEPFIRKNPTPKDQMHCILYVVKASSNLSTKVSPVVELMQDVRQLILEGMFLLSESNTKKNTFSLFSNVRPTDLNSGTTRFFISDLIFGRPTYLALVSSGAHRARA